MLSTRYCRFARHCEYCVYNKCLWIGYQSLYPCRDGWDDVEDEFVEQPIPKSTNECPPPSLPMTTTLANGTVTTTKSPVSPTEAGQTLLPLWIVISILVTLLGIVLIGVMVYRKYRRTQSRREETLSLQNLDHCWKDDDGDAEI